MKIAVTSHAVERYMERVEGAKNFEKESVRTIIRDLVEQGFAERAVTAHPLDHERRIVPFKSGGSILYLSIGPNTTTFDGDLAVIGVLFEHEVTQGKVGMGVTLGDVFRELQDMGASPSNHRYVVFVGSEESIESYKVKSDEEMHEFIAWRKPDPKRTFVYELREGFLENKMKGSA